LHPSKQAWSTPIDPELRQALPKRSDPVGQRSSV
jgi:hypothetical protein